MTPIEHLDIGFVTKQLVRPVPLGILGVLAWLVGTASLVLAFATALDLVY